MRKIVDGNKACAEVAYFFSEMSFIYPITPSSPMASEVDKLAEAGKRNLFNDRTEVIEMQSEAGAAGAMHGALLAGSLASTFTASQGLLLMIPNMYKMAGELLPGVIHVASRTVATHALSIFGDHSDIYATRGSGFALLSSSNVQDAYYLAIIAHLSAIKGSVPFLHFFDGFRTSHELNTINTLEESDLLSLIPFADIDKFRNKILNVGAGIQKGMAENEDIYFQSIEARNTEYNQLPDIVNEYMEKLNHLTNKEYQPFNYYGSADAKNVIVAMGSVCDTIKLVIDEEAKKTRKYGLIEVHLYRPFSSEYLKKVLPSGVENIAVLDRAKEIGSNGEALYLDVVNALNDSNITIVGGRYGLSSKNTTPSQIKSVFNMLENKKKNNFTIGIKDDVTNLSLPEVKYEIDLKTTEIRIYGFGSDGMVSAGKDLLEIVGLKTNKYVQGYMEYDSKKSGGITVSNLRIGDKPINAPYYVTNPDIVVITKDEYLKKFNMLEGIKNEGYLILNTDKKDLDNVIPDKVKKIIKAKELKLYIIDAQGIALSCGIKGKISKIMETVILSIMDIPQYKELLESSVRESFKTKGEEIIKANLKAIDETLHNLSIYEGNLVGEDSLQNESVNIFESIRKRQGDELSVRELMPYKEGTFPVSLVREEKRKIASLVPKWLSENCIQCTQCSMVCPHAVIRPFIVENTKIGIPLVGDKENKYNFIISVSEADCTNCTLCEKVCPGKGGKKALEFGPYEEKNQLLASELFKTENNSVFPKFTLKGSQLEKPKFEFSGACAGCGETPYIKLLTQLYGDSLVIANATGCSSIYGGSVPSTTYNIPWANSLFEDDAEFALGLHLAYSKIRNRIEHIMRESLDCVTPDIKEVFTSWLDNMDDFDLTSNIKNTLKDKEIPKDLKSLIDYIPSRSVWAIGGDGWAFDIGFGGLDHVLSSNEKVRILVLDSEVYSNTGGQSSKASHKGQIAEFAEMGKKTNKKDLFRIAMSYPHTYVASICLGADMMQSIKAFKEAEENEGPSIIIAYSTCVEHGIKGGMECSLDAQKRVVNCGYHLLMRYKEEKLYLDSKEPDFDKFEEFLDSEVRFNALKIKNQVLAEDLFKQNKEYAMKRYEYYKNLVGKEENNERDI